MADVFALVAVEPQREIPAAERGDFGRRDAGRLPSLLADLPMRVACAVEVDDGDDVCGTVAVELLLCHNRSEGPSIHGGKGVTTGDPAIMVAC